MGQSSCMNSLRVFLFITVSLFCVSNAAWANQSLEESSDVKVLIDEVKRLRTDIQRYGMVNYKVQAYVGRLQVQMAKVNSVSDGLAAIKAEIENLNSQNATDKEELSKFTEQASSLAQDMAERNDLNMQIKSITRSIFEREKMIKDLDTKEVQKDADLKEEQKKLEAISSDINLLEIELKER